MTQRVKDIGAVLLCLALVGLFLWSIKAGVWIDPRHSRRTWPLGVKPKETQVQTQSEAGPQDDDQ